MIKACMAKNTAMDILIVLYCNLFSASSSLFHFSCYRRAQTKNNFNFKAIFMKAYMPDIVVSMSLNLCCRNKNCFSKRPVKICI